MFGIKIVREVPPAGQGVAVVFPLVLIELAPKLTVAAAAAAPLVYTVTVVPTGPELDFSTKNVPAEGTVVTVVEAELPAESVTVSM